MKNFLLCLPFLFLISCATITRGVHEKLRIESDPPGANVQLSTGEKGVTPTKFVKNRRTENFTVTVSKPGYVTQTVKVESKFSGTGGTAMVGNAILGGIIGAGVDAASGSYNSLYPNPVSVHLAPSRKSTPAKHEVPKRKSASTTGAAKKSPEPKRPPQATPSPAPSKAPASEEQLPETTITPPQTSPPRE